MPQRACAQRASCTAAAVPPPPSQPQSKQQAQDAANHRGDPGVVQQGFVPAMRETARPSPKSQKDSNPEADDVVVALLTTRAERACSVVASRVVAKALTRTAGTAAGNGEALTIVAWWRRTAVRQMRPHVDAPAVCHAPLFRAADLSTALDRCDSRPHRDAAVQLGIRAFVGAARASSEKSTDRC